MKQLNPIEWLYKEANIMNERAKEWDKKFGKIVDKHIIQDGKLIPKNRPCDWCGGSVDIGYIHKECAKKESDFYMDILY